METNQREADVRTALENFGNVMETKFDWLHSEPNYVDQIGLTPSDTPQLIAIAREWLETYEKPWPEDDISVWAPIHAWRALGQLKAVEALPVICELIRPIDEHDDESLHEYLPAAIAQFGALAIEPMAQLQDDHSYTEWGRGVGSCVLGRIAQIDPSSRPTCLDKLIDKMSRYADETDIVNSQVVATLLDMRAVEATDVMQSAHEAGMVDELLCGPWEDVAYHLEHGEHPPPEPGSGIQWLPFHQPTTSLEPSGLSSQERKKERKKKKAKRQARKRNRR